MSTGEAFKWADVVGKFG